MPYQICKCLFLNGLIMGLNFGNSYPFDQEQRPEDDASRNDNDPKPPGGILCSFIYYLRPFENKGQRENKAADKINPDDRKNEINDHRFRLKNFQPITTAFQNNGFQFCFRENLFKTHLQTFVG